MASGTIGDYRWAECDRGAAGMRLPDVIRALSADLGGLRAVNVSWDSGRLLPGDREIDNSWTFVDTYAVSPTIGDRLVAGWPYSGEGFDEWYFFERVPATLAIAPWCNWEGVTLAQYGDLAFPGGVDLAQQLETYSPRLVLGEGLRMYILSRDEAAVWVFRSLVET
jgi:hypothetical protein